MSAVATAIAGAAIVGAYASDRASSKASKAQKGAAEAGIAEERYQFDEIQKLLAPYVQSGSTAMGGQMDLLGLNGAEKEAAAIQSVEQSPTFGALIKQGEQGILANASATGGLRGGNTQAALAEYRPSVLSSLLQQRFNQFGGIAQLGQASAAGQAAMGQQSGMNISNLLAQQGQAQAGRALAQGQNISNLANAAGQAGIMYSMGAF